MICGNLSQKKKNVQKKFEFLGERFMNEPTTIRRAKPVRMDENTLLAK